MSAAIAVGEHSELFVASLLPLAVRSSFWLFRGLAPGRVEAVAAVRRPGYLRQVDLRSFRPSSLRNCNYRQERRVP